LKAFGERGTNEVTGSISASGLMPQQFKVQANNCTSHASSGGNSSLKKPFKAFLRSSFLQFIAGLTVFFTVSIKACKQWSQIQWPKNEG
jgi:hypothetical protein